jgi:hypothetical protein
MNSKHSETELPLWPRLHIALWLKRGLAALALGGMLAGCGGPPALTSRATEGNLTSPYFDAVIRHEEPATIKSAEEYFLFRFRRDGTNTSNFISQKMAESGGNCRASKSETSCTMSRQITVEDCFRGNCGKRIKKWTLLISWRNGPNPIQPRVKISMTSEQINN